MKRNVPLVAKRKYNIWRNDPDMSVCIFVPYNKYR